MAKVPDRVTFLRQSDAERVQTQVREREREPRGDGVGRASRGPRVVAAFIDRWATLPAGGIAAGGSGTITYVRDSTTETAKNKWTTAAPASKKCLVGYDEYGDLIVKVWDC